MSDSYSTELAGAGAATGDAGVAAGGGAHTSPAASSYSNGNGHAETFQPAEPTYLDPPHSWAAEQRGHWPNLPHPVRGYIHQRESEVHKAITSQGERVKAYEPIDRVISQFKPSFERYGIDAPAAIERLFKAQHTLDQNPMDGLINLGLTYGIDLRPMLNGQQQRTAEQQELARFRQAEAQRQQQELHASQRQVAAFSKDKPYFEQVRSLMGALMERGHAATLDEAYDMAVNASPQLRGHASAERSKAAEAQRMVEARRKAADAQRAARLNVRSSSLSRENPRTMGDTIESLARKIYG